MKFVILKEIDYNINVCVNFTIDCGFRNYEFCQYTYTNHYASLWVEIPCNEHIGILCVMILWVKL